MVRRAPISRRRIAQNGALWLFPDALILTTLDHLGGGCLISHLFDAWRKIGRGLTKGKEEARWARYWR
jgi:hypothetical protein